MRLHQISSMVLLPFRRPSLLLVSLLFSVALYAANIQANVYDIQSPKWVIAMGILILFSPLFHGVVILRVRAVESGTDVTTWQALLQTAVSYPRLVVGEILVNLIVVAGLFLFILPGVYVGLRLIFYKQVILIDHATAVTALRVSSRRTTGWRISLFLLALLTPFYGLVILIGYVATVFSWGAFGEGLVVVASALFLIWTNTLLTSLYLEPVHKTHLGN